MNDYSFTVQLCEFLLILYFNHQPHTLQQNTRYLLDVTLSQRRLEPYQKP